VDLEHQLRPRRNAFGRILIMNRFSIATRMMFVFVVLAVTQAGIAAVGLHGYQRSNDDIAEVYQERLVPVSLLSRINDLMHVSVEQLTTAVIARPSPKNVLPYIERVDRNLSESDRLVRQYAQHVADDNDKKLLEDWIAKRGVLAEKGIKPAVAALQKQAFDDAEDTVLGVALKQFEATQQVFDAILARELENAQHTHDRANRRYDVTKYLTIGAIVLALGLCGAMAFYVKRAVTGPLIVLSAAMKSLAGGNKTVDIPYAARADEVGETAKAAQTFKDSLLRIDAMEAEQKEAATRAMAQRKSEMDRLADAFQATVGTIVTTVSSASRQLEAAAGTLADTADTTQRLSTTVTATSEQASAHVQSVATASEQLSGCVGEIARQVEESRRIAGQAVTQAGKTDTRMSELSQAAGRIGDVVKLITAIAEQTNLLALNATIEAARAGETGKGFAVVAQEVKALASQTAKATEEIGTQIATMQAATQESVAAIKEISGTIRRVSDIASTIAAAVEEQGTATEEISRNVQQAAAGTAQVAANITDVSRGAGATGSASTQVLSSARSLAGESSRLKLEVEKFLATVRAA
jgi:methyl-accepting chemotaxis protein